MFKDTDVEMSTTYFGVGSVVCCGYNRQEESWLLCANNNNEVFLVSNADFKICSDMVKVESINFLTANEARKVVKKVSDALGYAFTGFFLSTEGMKKTMFAQADAK